MSLEINHKTFGKSSVQSDTLIIELSEQSISFCEMYSKENKPLYNCVYPIDNSISLGLYEHFLDAVKYYQFSKKKYDVVYVNFFTGQFTLCPSILYNKESSRKLLEFNVGDTFDKLILEDDLNNDIKLIYSMDERLKSTLDLMFPNHQLKHKLTVLSKLHLYSEELSSVDVLLSLHEKHIEVVLKNNQKLILVNQYSVNTAEDVLYYVLFIIEQYHLNPLTVAITVVGNIESTDILIASLKKYIKNIHLAVSSKSIDWSAITGSPQHYNFTLINRQFCE
jgi:hypothetical protein